MGLLAAGIGAGEILKKENIAVVDKRESKD